MAFTQADLDALDTALKNGVKSVMFGDRRTEYRSTEEMLQVRSLIAKSISTRPKQTLIVANKGLVNKVCP